MVAIDVAYEGNHHACVSRSDGREIGRRNFEERCKANYRD
jgi:hypothetical protein